MPSVSLAESSIPYLAAPGFGSTSMRFGRRPIDLVPRTLTTKRDPYLGSLPPGALYRVLNAPEAPSALVSRQDGQDRGSRDGQ